MHACVTKRHCTRTIISKPDVGAPKLKLNITKNISLDHTLRQFTSIQVIKIDFPHFKSSGTGLVPPRRGALKVIPDQNSVVTYVRIWKATASNLDPVNSYPK